MLGMHFHTVVLIQWNCCFYNSTNWIYFCRGGRSWQNDGAENEGGGRKEKDKRNRGEDVLGGNQRTGFKSSLNLKIGVKCVELCFQSYDSKLWTECQVMKMGEKLQGLQEEKHQLFLQLKKVLHEEEKRRRKEQRYSGGRFFYYLIQYWEKFIYQLKFGASFFLVISQHWHPPATNPACPCMLGSTSSVFQVRRFYYILPIISSLLYYRKLISFIASSGSPVSHSRPGALLGERSKQLFPAAVIPVSKECFT